MLQHQLRGHVPGRTVGRPGADSGAWPGFYKLLQHSALLSYAEINQSSDKASVLNMKTNKLALLSWTCVPVGFSSAN